MLQFMTVKRQKDEYGFLKKVPRGKALLSEKKMTSWVRLAKMHLNKPQDFSNNVLLMYSAMFGESQTRWWSGDGLGLFCTHRTSAPSNH